MVIKLFSWPAAYSELITVTELVKNYEIPTKDAASAVTGKLVLQTGEKISVSASSLDSLKFILSVLESANE